MTYREQKIVNPLAEGTILRGAKQEYCIRKALGQGTFGITYRATTKMEGPLGAIEVNVAIKEFFMKSNNNRHGSEVTYSGSDNIFESYKKMFAREASNLGKLNHRHIVKVLEYFEANNTYYYVMEYCSGGSLDNVIARRGQLPEAEALHYFGQLSSAVSHMHAHKMLHLDIKPANIVLRENGELVLIDFGLSKQYDTDGNPESSTRIGAGTPGYAPIEQARHRRDSKQFAATLDVYALGATLFKMLTGVTPPDASEVAEEGLPVDMLRSHGVSEHLISCLTKAMSLRLKRYQSVSAFAQAVSGATHFDDSRQSDETHFDSGNDTRYHQPDDEEVIEVIEVEDPTSTPEPNPRKNLTWLWVTLVGIAGILLTIVGTNSYQSKAEEAKKATAQQVVSSEKTYQVGDYYDRNGIRGVVFEVSDGGRHGKVLSMDRGQTCWCTSSQYDKNITTGASSEWNGKSNTDKILSRSDRDEYLAFMWCRNKGSNWYLPSKEELLTMYRNKDKINATLSKQGGTLLDNWYWSSTEYSGRSAWDVNMYNGSTRNHAKYYDYNAVRAAAAF
ncbi:MAG: protein kinase [Bacteroidaceae bacterium]|nr:protein kinase [Bacteroidaceae bacterium]